MYLTDPYEVKDILGPAIEKLSPDAKLIFTGCNLLKTGDKPEEKLQIAMRIANNFNMKSGSLYLNEQGSVEALESMYCQPIINNESSAYENCTRTICQLLPFPFLLLISIVEYGFANGGYLLKIENNNGIKTYMLYDDYLQNARKDNKPAGKLIYQEKEK
ncbi:MAG: hypothetical protein WCG27_03500 [Pseudomonadota bacterium]